MADRIVALATQEKIRRIASIKTALKSRNTLRPHLTKTKPKTTDEKECVYKVSCECSEIYIGGPKPPLEVKIKEHKTHTQRVETSRSGIAEYTWDKQQHIKWSEAAAIYMESNTKKENV